MKSPTPLLLACTLLLCASVFAEPEIRLEDSRYLVSVDAAAGTFSVQSKPSGKTILTGGKLSGTGGKAKSLQPADKSFGAGTGIEIEYPNGSRELIALYPDLPFVLFRTTLHNGAAEPVVLNHVQTISAAIDLAIPAEKVRTLGTGGLLAPEKNPGSYAFLAVVDPESRRGVVGGWITHDRGSGVVFSPTDAGTMRMQAQIDYGRLRIKPGADALAETFAIGYFDDARIGLERYADAIAKVYAIKLPPHRPGYCTWYMEKHGGACDEKSLAELSAYAAKNLKPFGFDFIQIDDGWQEGTKGNGPKKNFTTHAPSGPYPAGMKATADAISKLDLTPGIWFMPFAGNYKDPFFKDHQDWFAKNPKGEPYETAWGGTCFDMTNPATQEYVKNVVTRIGHDWGYRVFKMDGFWTGSATKQIYVNNGYKEDGIGDATFANPDKTNIEALRDGVKLVRQAAGPDVFLLGCCVSQNMRSFGGSFGLLDAMRVGPDTGAGHIGAPHASRLWFLSGRIWWNDPDCVSVRAATPLDQARLNASFTTIAGDLFYNSDWMPDLSPERLDILRRCIPSHNLPSRPVDVFESPVARIWHLADTRPGRPRHDIVALYNWDKTPTTVSASAARIGLPAAAQYVAFDFWGNKFVPPFKENVSADLPAGGACRILAVRPVSENPQLLSTSRHITQGIIDVIGETWDASAHTLSATSSIVAEDPYELRIIVPVGDKSWRAIGISISPEDQAAGVKSEIKQDGPKIRVKITSPVSRTVKWQVQFDPAAIEIPAAQPATNLKAAASYRSVSLTWDDSGADRYRITRSDGASFETAAPTLIDSSTAHGKTYQYSVAAVGWDGPASKATSVEVATPAQLKKPASPPLPNVYLDAAGAKVIENGWGKPGINKSVTGKALIIEGKKYDKGLGTHAKSLAVCPVPAGAIRFVAVVGIDDAMRKDPRSSISFEVYGDVKEMGERPVLLAQSPVLSAESVRSWAFDVELNARYKELRLVVTDGGDGIAADHADWANPGFIVPGKK